MKQFKGVRMPKLGFISASMAKGVLTSGRKKDELFGQTFIKQAQAIGAGLLGWEVNEEIGHIPHIQHGIDFEPIAIICYEAETMVTVHGAQEWIESECGRFGCTPDGLVGNDGMIEVKCPKSVNHLSNILEQEQLKIYQPQMQFSLWLTGRQWCDWISFDPDAPEGLKLYIHRVFRDEKMIKQIAERAPMMHEMGQKYAEILRKQGNKN